MTGQRNSGVTRTYLDLIVLVNLLAGACGRRKTHILEGDLTLGLPAGTEEEDRKEGGHVGKMHMRIVAMTFTFLCW